MDKSKEIENKTKFFPACTDIYHDAESVVLTMEMPGVSKENLDIRVDNNILTINGARQFNYDDGDYIIKEIRHGDFHHEYTIDDTIDRDKIEASINNGLVTLTLGLKESQKPKKISINVQ